MFFQATFFGFLKIFLMCVNHMSAIITVLKKYFMTSWITHTLPLKSLSSILPASNWQRFQSVLILSGFHNQSAFFTDKEVEGTGARSDCSKKTKNGEKDQEKEEATTSYREWLLLNRAWSMAAAGVTVLSGLVDILKLTEWPKKLFQLATLFRFSPEWLWQEWRAANVIPRAKRNPPISIALQYQMDRMERDLGNFFLLRGKSSAVSPHQGKTTTTWKCFWKDDLDWTDGCAPFHLDVF